MERVNGEIVTSHRLRDGLFQVCIGDEAVGFIESAGIVFVALHGPRYDRAVEVAQSLAFDVAVAGLLAHVRDVRRVTDELSRPSADDDSGTCGAEDQRIA